MILPNELIVDAFCGGGGASEGIRRATGRSPDIAINHDEDAIVMHEANHPETMHLRESIWTVNPSKVTKGAPVGLLWASPDCTHFSRAKGGKPVNRRRRSLANVVIKWARDVKPRIICMENVPEFQTWGPLGKDHKPIQSRSGSYYGRWKRSLERLGYKVEDRIMVAADFGAPTTRKRLFIVARRDGQPINWPAKTHGKGCALPWQAVAGCIDWSIPCPSIFDRKRPLADATLRRIARGIMKYVVNDPKPFIVNLTHGVRLEDIDVPAKTITAAHRGEKALCSPIIAGCGGRAGQTQPRPGSAPMYTITKKADTAEVEVGLAPFIAGVGGPEYSGKPVPADLPTGTIVKENHRALAVAHLLKHFTTKTGDNLDARSPAGTITTQDHHSLTIAHLETHTTGHSGGKAEDPLSTITTGGQQALVAAHGVKMYGTSTGQDLTEPAHTITGQGLHAGVVAAFLQEYYGNGNPLKADNPIPTIVTKDRVALVTVEIEGSTYVIVDIGMRMLRPRELARAQGFQHDYKLTGNQSNQVAKIGNSVVPHCAEALVRAQLGLGPIHQDDQQDLLREAA
jgi:DNA (cytosine-5)-methyltransferase 1